MRQVQLTKHTSLRLLAVLYAGTGDITLLMRLLPARVSDELGVGGLQTCFRQSEQDSRRRT